MSKRNAIPYISEDDAVSNVVYVLAKLGYPRHKIAEVTKELKKTFNLKCNTRSFDANLKNGRIDRKHFLPTLSTKNGEQEDNKGV